MSICNPLKTVAIPASRHAQLQELASVRNCTIPDIIGEAIKEAISRNEIPDKTPGIDMTITKGLVKIQRERRAVAVAPSVAIAAADLIEKCLNSSSNSKSDFRIDARSLQEISVRRHGNAFILKFANDQFELALSGSVASDVARQLRALASTSIAIHRDSGDLRAMHASSA